jgi:hypothetical protein
LRSSRRPGLVTWLCLGGLILAAAYLLRFAGGLSIPDLPLSVPRWYPSVTGAIWGLGFLASVLGLWTGQRWAPALARGAGLLYVLWYWIDRLAFVRSDYARHSLPFSAGATALCLAGLLWTLSRQPVRDFYQETKV